MKKYVFYGEVQRCLSEYRAVHGEVISFFEAVVSLWKEGKYHTAQMLPPASFEEWDVSDPEGFRSAMERVPVDMDIFREGFENNLSAVQDALTPPVQKMCLMKIAEDQAIGTHEHKSFEMLYVLQGSAVVNLHGLHHSLPEGGFCLVGSYFPHDIEVEGHSIVMSITFEENIIESTLYKLLKDESIILDFFRVSLSPGKRGYLLFHVPPTPQLLGVIRNVYHEGYCGEEFSELLCVNYIEILFSYLLRSATGKYEQFSINQKTAWGAALLSTIKYIQSDFRTATLRETAQRFHYEPGYLGKLLKAHTGKSFTELIGDLRMQEACRLLRDSHLPTDQIAEEVGIMSAAHFSRSFQQHMGMTPSEYRKAGAGNH